MWGPCLVVSPTGFQYFVTFVDDYSRTTWLYLMKNRSKLFSHFSAFYAEIHTHFHVSIQSLRSDNAKNIFHNSFNHSYFKMAFFIKLPVLILLRKEWLRGRIDTFLKLPELYYFKCRFLSIYEPMLFPLLFFINRMSF